MRLGPVAPILVALVCSVGACQLVWSYDGYKEEAATSSTGGARTGSSPSSSSSSESSSSVSSSSSGCVDGGDPCDCDGDGFISWECLDAGDPMADCADHDPRANPDAGFEATTPIVPPMQPGLDPWDFNCDGTVEYPYGPLQCAQLSFIPPGCNASLQLVSAPSPSDCGTPVTVAICVAAGLFGLNCGRVDEGTVPLGCR